MALVPEDLDQLKIGEAVLKQERKGARGTGLFVTDVDAPPSLVLSVLRSFVEYPDMIPVVRHADVNYNNGTHARVHYKVSKFQLGVEVLHSVDGEAGVVSFDLDQAQSGPVLREASGRWSVEPSPCGDPARSRVTLSVSLRASSLLPHWLVDYAAQRAMRRATSWLKPYMAQRWREQREGLTRMLRVQMLQESVRSTHQLRLRTA